MNRQFYIWAWNRMILWTKNPRLFIHHSRGENEVCKTLLTLSFSRAMLYLHPFFSQNQFFAMYPFRDTGLTLRGMLLTGWDSVEPIMRLNKWGVLVLIVIRTDQDQSEPIRADQDRSGLWKPWYSRVLIGPDQSRDTWPVTWSVLIDTWHVTGRQKSPKHPGSSSAPFYS